MSGVIPPAIVWPLIVTLLLAMLPGKVGTRGYVVVALAGSLVTLLLSVLQALSVVDAGSGGLWVHDRLAVALALPLSVPGVLLTASLVAGVPPAPTDGWRRQLVAAQLLNAGAITATRADPLFLMLVGFVIMAGAASMLVSDRERPGHIAMLAGTLLTAWLGIAMFTAGLGAPAGWSRLSAGPSVMHPALRMFGLLLLLLPMMLLAWIGSASASGTRIPDPARADPVVGPVLLPVLFALPALTVALRLHALPESDPLLLRLEIGVQVASGLSMMLLAVCLMPGRRTLGGRVALAAMVQVGAAAVGIGVGGTGGVAASVLILSFLSLGLPLALLPSMSGAGSVMRRLAVLSLAGLPPFGPFVAAFVLLLRLFADMPILAVSVLAAVCATAIGLLSSLRRARHDSPDVDRSGSRVSRVAPLASGFVALALLASLGLAMPSSLSGWLLGVSETFSGASWPARNPALRDTVP
ncbi:MAG: hypothetical protein ACRYGI_12040 [Janthinobacterium lividum]